MFSILVIDDEPNNFDVIETFLEDEQYRLYYAASGEDAFKSLDLFNPDLILLDVMMAGLDGIECCRRLKAMERWQSVPIIIVTALATKADLAQCMSAGADDFISKPVNRIELTARVRSMLRIRHQYQQLEEFNTRLETMVQHRTAQLRQMLFQDALTLLPSRAGLLQTFQQRQAIKLLSWGLIALDCDRFKLVNGSFGHQVGDRLLRAIAQRLNQQLSPRQWLGRTGGDEFSILIENVECDEQLEAWVTRILAVFTEPFWVEGYEIFITVSIGVARTNSSTRDGERLFQDADTAMYQAKSKGKNSYQVFDAQMHVAMLQRLTVENDLQLAFKQSDFTVYYQPIFDLNTEHLAGFEALIRWRHPNRGLVSPGEFIPSMEMTGLIVSVGLWVLRQACEQLRDWHRRGRSDLTMSVNLSVRQFASPTLLADDDDARLIGIITHESLRQQTRPFDLLRLLSAVEVMSVRVVTARQDCSVLDIARLMAERRVSSVVMTVVEGSDEAPLERAVGLLTERDLVQFQSLGASLAETKVSDVMSSPVF
ncbi:diguanylate cyclase [Oscillatoria sp. FACHB-1406]|uniref:diguanylate cyclase domain-containing protein n=1 Tax=Oscillatoria sp. FACHB-1406 TaxID=2692846 RepID=UPI0016878E9A|nr:diguanylate cyclase [Oscillatoria sp. FACHB-1406]MBD2578041.1 diguanylate cyclase [Oscillatoria sp. FACHB-1406]